MDNKITGFDKQCLLKAIDTATLALKNGNLA